MVDDVGEAEAQVVDVEAYAENDRTVSPGNIQVLVLEARLRCATMRWKALSQ